MNNKVCLRLSRPESMLLKLLSSGLFGHGPQLFNETEYFRRFSTVTSVSVFSLKLALKMAVVGTAETSAVINSFGPRPNSPENNNFNNVVSGREILRQTLLSVSYTHLEYL